MEVGDRVFIVGYDIKESRDFRGMKDEEYGIKTLERPRAVFIEKVMNNSVIVNFHNKERTTVKKELVFPNKKRCEEGIAEMRRIKSTKRR